MTFLSFHLSASKIFLETLLWEQDVFILCDKISTLYLVPLPSPNTMLCQLSLHEKQCKRIQNNISRILFYQNMCHWMVHLKRFSGGAYLSIKHCLVIHIHQWELLKAVYCPARCVNDWPRWSETYPNIQTHSFFSCRRY